MEWEAPARLMKIECMEQKANHTGSTVAIKFIENFDKHSFAGIPSGETTKVGETRSSGESKKYRLLADFPCCLVDYRQIAKHYLIKSTSHPYTRLPSNTGQFQNEKQGIRRHYTEAFSMRKQVY
mmetsp:Transcript_2610/g.4039  ORF Transcript_2610/g.4039 Transcript_2610/m.4039 type:complete len:124 (-) Transcript_2610:716-1087(-)